MSNWLEKLDNGSIKLDSLTISEQTELCSEIRDELISVVSKTGGHLASNLGVVELTVALHSVFSFPSDTIIFDVGHQCYVHKILSGRYKYFSTLRQEDGISGFPKPSESINDSFIEGHASTSISQAVGLSHAKALNNEDTKTIAVIGDGALTGGLAYEAMNNISTRCKNLIVILNDNSMSISKSVGSVSEYLLKLRNNKTYLNIKDTVQSVLKYVPFLGNILTKFILKLKSRLRRNLFGGILFEELGFNYVGPLDGHDISELEAVFRQLKDAGRGPYLVHVITQKGKGYSFAEENPGAYHGVSSFDVEKENPDIADADSFSNTFGRKLLDIACFDDNVCAVTAAMKYGTGLEYFAKNFPERFFDVGIAEQHAVTMCSGLSKGGKLPYFCVYSTFLQRAVDGLIHDISLDDIDFVLGIDRAGFVGDDGETHQGLYDVSILSSIGTFSVFSPSNYSDLMGMMDEIHKLKGPRAIRYPRGKEDTRISDYTYSGNSFDVISSGKSEVVIITYGREFAEVKESALMLKSDGINADILKLNRIYPIDNDAVITASKYKFILFAEEALRRGGIAEQFLDKLNALKYAGKYDITAIENTKVKQASVKRQLEIAGLDANSIYNKLKEEN